ncbi:hypothetical protein ACFO0S_13975 [Chryseomicrobium palamuruense]|uniref:Uncharacterized protein n=1 Tax=Chryseomicrobium palamuruense TaxID=682973 RepID=A0ABV8UXT3_9BACL
MTISILVLVGMVMLYLLIKHVVQELYPPVTFYVTMLFFLVFTISCIQLLVPVIGPLYQQLSVANHPVIKAFLITFLALASLEVFQSYLQSEQEDAISKLLEMVIKCFLLVYWIAYFQQMR